MTTTMNIINKIYQFCTCHFFGIQFNDLKVILIEQNTLQKNIAGKIQRLDIIHTLPYGRLLFTNCNKWFDFHSI